MKYYKDLTIIIITFKSDEIIYNFDSRPQPRGDRFEYI